MARPGPGPYPAAASSPTRAPQATPAPQAAPAPQPAHAPQAAPSPNATPGPYAPSASPAPSSSLAPPAARATQAGPAATSPAAATAGGGSVLAQIPYLIVLACTIGGVVWAWRGAHAVSNGAGVVGGALLAGALARLLLPQSAVGLLANRRRFADVLALGLLGVGLLVLALVLPPT
ncbi:MAG TPA: DUF3017 domain-containing protein [Streptosporangiaceae bacterium]